MSAKVINKLKMIETTVDGIIDRINRLETTLREFDDSRKNLMYVDEEKALVSSHKTDAEYLQNELSSLRNQ
jgi:chaperonin cofactor prefoldin